MKLISHFRFKKSQRSGIFFLLLIVTSIQLISIGWTSFSPQKEIVAITIPAEVSQTTSNYTIYPFNPNYISDFKGYSLGLTSNEIDKLLAYRAKGLYVNSKEDFKKVTGVSDSLLKTIAPYFKFPVFKPFVRKEKSAKKVVVRLDINGATKEELIAVYGIGEKLSERIIKYRSLLKGFYFKDQLAEVYGLKPEVILQLWKKFEIKDLPEYNQYNINNISVRELSSLPYINWELAIKIVSYRTEHQKINSIAELTKIEDFPTDKLNRIELYLSLD
ncbi:helix-hairpin-helix domain-containing protein [Joostella atrarenae]|uniref:Helix-hairpin-helix domain-containing protein n=1 Tax=Joostella atrarenae TaxID=679257 RepID=A0ABS9J6P0_9FLAO|nr:helix-hairpin-helix domain-containing protein [Joostella atrarenae]MCF8716076.1 helix-hairpin-helix domain-containing protein [Joostella atrarenae]